jgi:hypothetical protein
LKSAVVTNCKRVKRLCIAHSFFEGGAFFSIPFRILIYATYPRSIYSRRYFFFLNHKIKFICPSIVDDADGYIWKRAAMGRGKCREVAWIRANKKDERDSIALSAPRRGNLIGPIWYSGPHAQQDPLEENGMMAGRFIPAVVWILISIFYISVKNKQKNGGARLDNNWIERWSHDIRSAPTPI